MSIRDLFLRRLEELAVQFAARPAVVAEGHVATFGALWQAASQVAAFLVGEGVQPGDRLGLLGVKTVHDFEHLLGIWLAGAAYVPLNHKFPPARNRGILFAAGARGVLAGPRSDALAKEISGTAGASVPGGASTYHRLPAQLVAGANEETDTADLAYIIFTSGSTGAPKGVPITFGNLAAYLANLQAAYPASARDRVAQLADLSFDASVHEIALSWSIGATLYVVPAAGALMWPRYAQEHHVTSMLVVPSAVLLAARAGLLAPASLPALRLAFVGAETVTPEVVRTMHAAAPHAQVVNIWGLTESTVLFTHFAVDRAKPIPDPVPIGLPFAGQQMKLRDGEIVQTGSQLMSGYWRNPEANHERFLDEDGQRWFRTGDLARFDAALGYIFLGRRDRQVKVRGYRVELPECEAAIRSVSGFDQVAVVLVADRLACFVAGPTVVDAAALKSELKKRLPDYMVPASFEQLEEMPLGATGKTDYSALAQRAQVQR
ncbi:MAG TPA: amino acid adenylation domain-containing protein [Ramlibacter sp.]|nr:amino acid adenylation domain-containing protein [Ramlibacter sp.]